MNSKGPRLCFNFCYWLEVDVKHDRNLHSKARKAEQNIKKTKTKKLLLRLIRQFEGGPRLSLNFSASQRCPWDEQH